MTIQIGSPYDASQYALIVSMGHGGVVYVNGVAVATINLAPGSNYYSRAGTCQPAYGQWQAPIVFGSALLRPGPNVIAVEVHFCSSTYDLYFAAALVADAADFNTPYVPSPQIAVGCANGSRPQDDNTLSSWTSLFGSALSPNLTIVIPTGLRVLLDTSVVVVASITVK